MRAFLSHSSRDKYVVRQVADALGDAHCEYDERSFEYEFNVKAIRDALDRSDLFVYFLSAQSIHSNFVKEEQRAALERRGAGIIRRVLVITLDETSYRALPTWMQEINVIQRLSSPKIIARKIQAALVRLQAEDDESAEIYIGRDAEDAALTKALAGEPAKTPIALHAVGHYGVGRKTYLRRNLQRVFPRRFDTFPEITISANQGIEELFRQIRDVAVTGAIRDLVTEMEGFGAASPEGKASRVASYLQRLVDAGEFLIITDDGGVYTEEGDYQPHIRDVLSIVNGRGLPVVGFIQTRMMPAKFKEANRRSFHQYLSALDDSSARQVLGLILKQIDVNYSDTQIEQITDMLDGHPFNIKFVAQFAADYGLENLLADPSELVDWKRRRAEDFLKKMKFSQIEADILGALSDYRYLAPETIFTILPYKLAEIAADLRRLQEYSCVERREGYCHIAPPLRDAIRRDKRFERPESWRQQIGQRICDTIADYKDSDQISLAILDSAVLAAARGHSALPFLATLILPSHLLRIARDYYDAEKYGLCVEFCKKAWDSRTRLPAEGQIEVLRLWGLSSVRINDTDGYDGVVSQLSGMPGTASQRIRLFLEGFSARVHRRQDEAEKKFRSAWSIAPFNQSINRELASLLSKQGRYSEAERFARVAYEQSPTNPFIVDVMAEVLIGKTQQGLTVDRREYDRVMDDLRRYGDAPGSSFFLIREAQAARAGSKNREALRIIDRAISRTPGLKPAYFMRAEICLALNDIPGAERDLNEIGRLLERAGGFSEGDEARLQALEVRILIERRLFREAKELVDRSAWIPNRVARRLKEEIAKAVIYFPAGVDDALTQWAKKQDQMRASGGPRRRHSRRG